MKALLVMTLPYSRCLVTQAVPFLLVPRRVGDRELAVAVFGHSRFLLPGRKLDLNGVLVPIKTRLDGSFSERGSLDIDRVVDGEGVCHTGLEGDTVDWRWRNACPQGLPTGHPDDIVVRLESTASCNRELAVPRGRVLIIWRGFFKGRVLIKDENSPIPCLRSEGDLLVGLRIDDAAGAEAGGARHGAHESVERVVESEGDLSSGSKLSGSEPHDGLGGVRSVPTALDGGLGGKEVVHLARTARVVDDFDSV